MSYTPTNWQTGDTITAEKLNNMESGISGAFEVFLLHMKPDFTGMDESLEDACAAYDAGVPVIFVAGIFPCVCSAHTQSGGKTTGLKWTTVYIDSGQWYFETDTWTSEGLGAEGGWQITTSAVGN